MAPWTLSRSTAGSAAAAAASPKSEPAQPSSRRAPADELFGKLPGRVASRRAVMSTATAAVATLGRFADAMPIARARFLLWRGVCACTRKSAPPPQPAAHSRGCPGYLRTAMAPRQARGAQWQRALLLRPHADAWPAVADLADVQAFDNFNIWPPVKAFRVRPFATRPARR
jgi:hypothetical protein